MPKLIVGEISSHKQKIFKWIGLFFVIAVTFAVFIPSLRNGFIWDDQKNLIDNMQFRGFSLGQLKWMFTTMEGGPYQPLTWLSFACDYCFWGMNPFGYHFLNIVIHSLNAALFYFICLRVFSPNKSADWRIIFSAASSALFFSVHPLRVESVAWITERRDVLSGSFYLGAFLLYLQYCDNNMSLMRRRLCFMGGWVSYVFALLAKGTAITFPIAILIIDFYPFKRLSNKPLDWFSPKYRTVWLEKLVFLGPSLLFGFIGLVGQAQFGGMPTIQSFGLIDRVVLALYDVAFYVSKTFLPHALVPLYEMPEPFNPFTFQFLCGAICTLTISAVLLKRAKVWPALLAAWLYFIAALIPVIGIVKFGQQMAADRYTYLPSFGIALVVGLGILKLLHMNFRLVRLGVPVAATLVLAVLAILTWRQAAIWHDELTLWEYTRVVRPNQAVVSYTLGTIMDKDGKKDEAIQYYIEAAKIRPRYFQSFLNLALENSSHGQYGQADEYFQVVLKGDPENATAHNAFGVALVMQKKLDAGVAQFREALRLAPDYTAAAKNLESALHLKNFH